MNLTTPTGKKLITTETQEKILENIIETLLNLDNTNVIEGIYIANYCFDNCKLDNWIDIYVEFDLDAEIPDELDYYMFEISDKRRNAQKNEISVFLMTEYTGPGFPKGVCIWMKGDSN